MFHKFNIGDLLQSKTGRTYMIVDDDAYGRILLEDVNDPGAEVPSITAEDLASFEHLPWEEAAGMVHCVVGS